MQTAIVTAWVGWIGWACSAAAAGPATVNESAREVPVACQVDVVVVGGNTGAVSAATAAARAGAKVFLAAPRPYLGDDMTATLRLWLEPGEKPSTPLAKALFQDPQDPSNLPDPNALLFHYTADRPAGSRHPDTTPPSRLSDQIWGRAASDSVQFDDDVNVVVDLGAVHEVATLRVRAYQRHGPGGYEVGKITLATSDDKIRWKPRGQMGKPAQGPEELVTFTAPVALSTRYVRLFFEKSPGTRRMLLGEIEVSAPAPEAMKAVHALRPWPRPMHIKRTLDKALLAAGVPFLYNCPVTDVLRDGQGKLCGIVMANRAGRQAVIARTIIDATEQALVARLAGAARRPCPAGVQTFRRVVIGGEVQHVAPGMTARTIDPPFVGNYPNQAKTRSGLFPIIEYTLRLPLTADTPAAWATADQQARGMTYHPEQQFTSDVLFQVPPNPLFGQATAAGAWSGVDALPLGAFRPRGLDRLLVLGGCADVSRNQAEKLLQPLALIDLGERLGKEAAAEAKSCPSPERPTVVGVPSEPPAEPGDVAELLVGLRPGQTAAKIHSPARPLPVLGRYDVVVAGGGTSGAPAGIAAGRKKAKTLVIEQHYGLGGVGTLGAISSYCSGNRVGFTAEVGGGPSWVIEQKMEWWRTTLLKSGAEVWFGTTACGAFVDRGRVRGLVVVTPSGRGVVLAKVVVDATGSADVAAAAGAECVDTDASEFAMQGTGLPGRKLGASYTNTDYTYTDETDLVDVWRLMVSAKDMFPEAFDLGSLVDTRQRRRIVGDYTLTTFDQLTHRTFSDSIALAMAGYDTHGYVIDPGYLLRSPTGRLTSYVPYRCLLPRGLEGLLVTGIGLSADRDAQPVVRMQPDIQNQGYAAGAAAAMAAAEGTPLRNIDIRALQRHLVQIGNLPKSVLTDEDSPAPSHAAVAAAVRTVADDSRSLAIVLRQPNESLPLLREQYRTSRGRTRIVSAKVLGMLGDATGLKTLLAEINQADGWDATPDWRIDKSDPQFGLAGWITSHLDNTLMALGRTGRAEAVPAVLKMLASLSPESALSHHRATYLALEWLHDPRAARPLAELLRRPGMGGYAVAAIGQADARKSTRQQATRELLLARALYRCGDWEGLGEQTLRAYSEDLRGHFARHAQAVLAAGNKYRP